MTSPGFLQQGQQTRASIRLLYCSRAYRAPARKVHALKRLSLHYQQVPLGLPEERQHRCEQPQLWQQQVLQ